MVVTKPVEYKILKAKSTEELEKVVNIILKENWTLHGDLVLLDAGASGRVYCQAVSQLGFINVEMTGPAPGSGLLLPPR